MVRVRELQRENIGVLNISATCDIQVIGKQKKSSLGKGGEGGGLGPKSVRTKNGPTGFAQRRISRFPTMVTLV